MATAIFFGLPAHGHTNPTLPIVAELVRQGEHIIYYSTEEFRPAIESTGADFRTYGDAIPFNEIILDENGFRIIRRLFQFEALHDDPLLYISFRNACSSTDRVLSLLLSSLRAQRLSSGDV